MHKEREEEKEKRRNRVIRGVFSEEVTLPLSCEELNGIRHAKDRKKNFLRKWQLATASAKALRQKRA